MFNDFVMETLKTDILSGTKNVLNFM